MQMTYSIVFCSKTGNTQLLAEKIKETLDGECMCFGEPTVDAVAADIIFAGSWTDKGTCDERMKEFLAGLENKKVFLFGTAGFGGKEAYFNQILGRVKENLKQSNQVVGTYMCQGKMPMGVRARYEKMSIENPEDKKFDGMIANFDKALSHPDQNDLDALVTEVKNVISNNQ